jgi:hypothetical protein
MVRAMMFNATFNNISVISWQSVLLVEETVVHGEDLPQVTDKLYYIMLYQVFFAWVWFELALEVSGIIMYTFTGIIMYRFTGIIMYRFTGIIMYRFTGIIMMDNETNITFKKKNQLVGKYIWHF